MNQSYEMPTVGVRFRILAFVLAFVGFAFIAMAVWVFLLPVLADLQRGYITIFTANRGVGVTWSQVYAFRDHPGDFIVGVLSEVAGALGWGGFGAFVSFACLLRAFGPADIQFSPRGKRLATYWVFGCMAIIVLYFLLWVFPYLLRYGVLP